MRESLRPDGTSVTAGHRFRSLLCGMVAALLGTVLVAPAPASAAPACGREGGPGPTESPWALRRLDPQSAWRITRGEGVTVAVVDSGVSATHPLLKGRVLPGADFNGLPRQQGQCDGAGHGTIVAGIIAGREGTGTAYSGIAPGARILPVRVLATTERTTDEALPGEIAKAIRWAVDHDADVVNLSLVTLDRPELREAIDYALRGAPAGGVLGTGSLAGSGRGTPSSARPAGGMAGAENRSAAGTGRLASGRAGAVDGEGRGGGGRGAAGRSAMAGANRNGVLGGHGQRDEDESDERLTWLTEDEMVWQDGETAPPPVLGTT